MPSHTIHSALADMFHKSKGAPWTFPVWQDLTGVRQGLFSTEDNHLPAGWTRHTATDISSYFAQFRVLKSEDDQVKFSSGKKDVCLFPGRKAWKDWINRGWKKWKIHDKIIDVLVAERLHPFILTESTGSWPDANDWVPLAVDPVGTALFGEESLDSTDRVRNDLRAATRAIIQRTWIFLHNSHKRWKNRIVQLEGEVTMAFEGSCSSFLAVAPSLSAC
jgi:TATA-binding protein-associated factor